MKNLGTGMWRRIGDYDRAIAPINSKQSILIQRAIQIEEFKKEAANNVLKQELLRKSKQLISNSENKNSELIPEQNIIRTNQIKFLEYEKELERRNKINSYRKEIIILQNVINNDNVLTKPSLIEEEEVKEEEIFIQEVLKEEEVKEKEPLTNDLLKEEEVKEVELKEEVLIKNKKGRKNKNKK